MYGNPIVTSYNDKEINDHMFHPLKRSRKIINVEDNYEEEETNLDDSDIYAGFDEYGNRIEEIDCE